MAFVPQQSKPRYKPGEYAAMMREESQRWSNGPKRPAPPPQKGAPFGAEMDLTEIDEYGKPMLTFVARATQLSGTHLSFRCRRMCYAKRNVIAAVHLVDDQPVPLYGEVETSEYDGDGMCLTWIKLLEMPRNSILQDWLKANGIKGAL
ncbi:MAG: hypothetical protein H7210_02450 [Pyrinomonadaceae bacterium]|nr:hypothetical protein [Phycisphaerales bacterium]